MKRTSAFTLVELAIVLVIIGLLVGGILAGRDLIKAGEIRSTAAQLEGFWTAARTFQSKYGGLPGDLSSAKAIEYSLMARSGAVGRGDGNMLVEGAASGSPAPGGEVVLFWADLAAVKLVGGSYLATDCAGPGGACTAVTTLNNVFPSLKLGNNNYALFTAENGYPLVWIFNGAGVGIDTTATGGWSGTPGLGLSPQQAFSMDEKLDDGYPNGGSVRSRAYGGSASAALAAGAEGVAGAGSCGNTSTTPTSYNKTANYIDSALCSLSFRMN